MGLRVNDDEIEAALTALAEAQTVPSNKHAVAVAILRHALRDGVEAANLWLHDGQWQPDSPRPRGLHELKTEHRGAGKE